MQKKENFLINSDKTLTILQVTTFSFTYFSHLYRHSYITWQIRQDKFNSHIKYDEIITSSSWCVISKRW